MKFDGEEIVSVLSQLGITHVVWIPDSSLGLWESALEAAPDIQLVRVCREGEAWPLAAGLYLGGQKPIILMQTTGLFESGDALRNIVHDLKIPVLSIIGARNWLTADSADTAKAFTEPILSAWDISYQLIEAEDQKPQLHRFLHDCLAADRSGAILLAE